MIFKFVWNEKTDRIKREVLKQHKLQGGIGVPDIILKDKSLKLAWINRLLKTDSKWTFLVYRQLPIKENYIWDCNLRINDIAILTNHVNNQFIIDIIETWFEFKFCEPTNISEIASQPLWFNSLIKTNNKPFF